MWRDGSITRLDVLPHLVDRHQRLISSQPIYWWSPDWSLLPLCFAERHLWHNHPSYLDILCQLKLTNGRILFFKIYSLMGWLFINWKTFEASITIGPYYKISVNLSFSVSFISTPSVPIKSGSKNSHWPKNHVHILHLDPSLRVSKWFRRLFWCHQSGSRDEYSAPSPVHITTTCFN